ncbi:endonuclease/exonuclease/phosphatase family protein [Pseudarthrobacter sp. AB1]|uniref:endonuclease/exonuclease/phosphatase family protein n=1 Tax=Pseudarthrobacter sp. AB1 TaxID=2138309 RepID=UPI00186B9C83|nr:endonuclease/exonuclease/phosphatase family protein [Pseudarthrobacter sp. AB1]
MRIVSWNCAMGYAKKRWLVEALQPDVAVLQEVSQRHIAETDAPFKAWVGSNPHKGLGVIGYTGRSHTLHEAGRLLPWHIPFTVDGVNIVALWAHVRDKDLKYVRVTHEVVDRHADFLTSAPSLLIGDFNSNTIWDREHPGRNHSLLVDKLQGLGLRSVHHRTEGIAHGVEITKTYFHTKKLHFGHHIDYAFLRGASASLEIGRYEDWLQFSDHMPLILDIKLFEEAAVPARPASPAR